jgi:hypothetical protein
MSRRITGKMICRGKKDPWPPVTKEVPMSLGAWTCPSQNQFSFKMAAKESTGYMLAYKALCKHDSGLKSLLQDLQGKAYFRAAHGLKWGKLGQAVCRGEPAQGAFRALEINGTVTECLSLISEKSRGREVYRKQKPYSALTGCAWELCAACVPERQPRRGGTWSTSHPCAGPGD